MVDGGGGWWVVVVGRCTSCRLCGTMTLFEGSPRQGGGCSRVTTSGLKYARSGGTPTDRPAFGPGGRWWTPKGQALRQAPREVDPGALQDPGWFGHRGAALQSCTVVPSGGTPVRGAPPGPASCQARWTSTQAAPLPALGGAGRLGAAGDAPSPRTPSGHLGAGSIPMDLPLDKSPQGAAATSPAAVARSGGTFLSN